MSAPDIPEWKKRQERLKKEEEERIAQQNKEKAEKLAHLESVEANPDPNESQECGLVDDEERAQLEDERIEKRFEKSLADAKPKKIIKKFKLSSDVKFGEELVFIKSDSNEKIIEKSNEFGKQLFNEINALRADPKEYSQTLINLKPFYKDDGSIVSPTGSGLQITTEEGVTALNEAIDLLKKFPPLPQLKELSDGLNQSCQTYTNEQKDSLSPPIGAKKRGKLNGTFKKYKELLSIGAGTPKEAVWRWLIDDGNAERSKRKLLLDADFTHMGAAVQYNDSVHSVLLLALAVDYAQN